jgi:hypothetical protein
MSETQGTLLLPQKRKQPTEDLAITADYLGISCTKMTKLVKKGVFHFTFEASERFPLGRWVRQGSLEKAKTDYEQWKIDFICRYPPNPHPKQRLREEQAAAATAQLLALSPAASPVVSLVPKTAATEPAPEWSHWTTSYGNTLPYEMVLWCEAEMKRKGYKKLSQVYSELIIEGVKRRIAEEAARKKA